MYYYYCTLNSHSASNIVHFGVYILYTTVYICTCRWNVFILFYFIILFLAHGGKRSSHGESGTLTTKWGRKKVSYSEWEGFHAWVKMKKKKNAWCSCPPLLTIETPAANGSRAHPHEGRWCLQTV